MTLLLLIISLTIAQPASMPATAPTAGPSSAPTSQPARQIVEYPLPDESEFTKLVGPIARCYALTLPAKTFADLRCLRFTPEGQMDRIPLSEAKGGAKYSLFVPPSYGTGLKSFGLMVWIAPERGVENRPDWRAVLDAHEMIFIAPHGVPNESHSAWRIFMGMESVRQMKSKFNIDPDRIYIAGMSGGGRISSHAAVFFPDVFTGAFCIVGCNFYRNTPAERKNEIYPGFWPNPNMPAIQRGRANTRLVLLTGDNDFNRPSTKAAYDAYVADNWKYVTYLQVPGMDHNRPDAEWFEKGVAALDAPLIEMARTQYEKGLVLEKKRKLGEACLAYESAARHGANESFASDAAHRGSLIRQKFEDRLADARNLAENRKFDQANSAARQIKSDYGPLAADDVETLFARIRELRKTGN